jgi:hypothetical protein
MYLIVVAEACTAILHRPPVKRPKVEPTNERERYGNQTSAASADAPHEGSWIDDLASVGQTTTRTHMGFKALVLWKGRNTINRAPHSLAGKQSLGFKLVKGWHGGTLGNVSGLLLTLPGAYFF